MDNKLYPVLVGVIIVALIGGAYVMGTQKVNNSAPIAVQASVDNAGIFVNGVGEIKATPDVLVFNGTVAYTADNAKDALDRTSVIVNKLQDELDNYNVAKKDITTSNISVNPRYNYTNNESRIEGYEATNSLTVKLKDLDKAGEVLATLQTVGGNDLRLNGISFAVDDPEEALNEARAEAVKDARKNAEILANASGQKVGAVIYMTDSSAPQMPYYARSMEMGMAADDVDVPVNPGEQSITVTVEVRFALA